MIFQLSMNTTSADAIRFTPNYKPTWKSETNRRRDNDRMPRLPSRYVYRYHLIRSKFFVSFASRYARVLFSQRWIRARRESQRCVYSPLLPATVFKDDASPCSERQWPRSLGGHDENPIFCSNNPRSERKGWRCRDPIVRSVGIVIRLHTGPCPHHAVFREKIIDEINLQSATTSTRSPSMVGRSAFSGTRSVTEVMRST